MCVYVYVYVYVQGTRSLGMIFGADANDALWRHIGDDPRPPWRRILTTHSLTTHCPLTAHYPLTTHCDDTFPDDALRVDSLGMRSKGAGVL